MRKYLMEIFITIGCGIWFLTIGLLLAFPGIRGVAVLFIFVGIGFILLGGRQKVLREQKQEKVSNTRPGEWERYDR